MDYRLAALEDIPVLAEMRWERDPSQSVSVNIAEFMQVCQRFLEEAFSNGRWYIRVAAKEEELLSHIYVQIIEKVPRLASFHPCFGYVTNVYTRSAWRGQGIGGELMENGHQLGKSGRVRNAGRLAQPGEHRVLPTSRF